MEEHQTTRRETVTGGELRDYPGCWRLTVRIEGKTEEWSVVRKPDGTYWEVVGIHILPRTGVLQEIDIGDRITDTSTLARCEAYYTQLQESVNGSGTPTEQL